MSTVNLTPEVEQAIVRRRELVRRLTAVHDALGDINKQFPVVSERLVIGRRIKDEEREIRLLQAGCVDEKGELRHRPKKPTLCAIDLQRAVGE